MSATSDLTEILEPFGRNLQIKAIRRCADFVEQMLQEKLVRPDEIPGLLRDLAASIQKKGASQ